MAPGLCALAGAWFVLRAAEPPPAPPPATSNAPAAASVSIRPFDWRDVLRPEYADYLARLRAAGCPEHHVRHIVVSDVVNYFDAARLELALEADFEWWKPGAGPKVARGWSAADIEAREAQRQQLLQRYLGEEAARTVRLVPLSLAQDASLTGRVLGSMPLDRFAAAAEICQRSRQRMLDYRTACFNQGQASDPVEETRLRDQTRQELSHLLTPEEMDEFLVRNSHNAETLRQNLRGFDATPAEFLKIFRALDPILHAMQRDYGHESALSARQRETLERQCRQAVQAVLPPERFQAWLQTTDPLYKRAQADGALWGLRGEAVARLFAFYREKAAEKERLARDNTLSPEQRTQALQAVAREEQNFLASLAEGQRSNRQP